MSPANDGPALGGEGEDSDEQSEGGGVGDDEGGGSASSSSREKTTTPADSAEKSNAASASATSASASAFTSRYGGDVVATARMNRGGGSPEYTLSQMAQRSSSDEEGAKRGPSPDSTGDLGGPPSVDARTADSSRNNSPDPFDSNMWLPPLAADSSRVMLVRW